MQHNSEDQMYYLKEGLLLRKGKQYSRYQCVYIPHNLRTDILRAYHDSPTAGHVGQKKTLQSIQMRYFWPGMTKVIRSYVERCRSCTERKNPYKNQLLVVQCFQTITRPGERTHMDIVGPLTPTNNGKKIYSDLYTCFF